MNNLDLLKLIELKALGLSRQEIASKLNVHPTTIWQASQTSEYKELWEKTIEEAVEAVRESFKVRAKDAADKVYVLMARSPSDKVALEAAKDILSRGGFVAKQEVEHIHVVRIEQTRAKLISQTAKQLGVGPAPGMVEAEFEEVPLLPDESLTGSLEADNPSSPRDVQLHSGDNQGVDAGPSGSLQDNDCFRGLPNLAVNKQL